MSHPFQKLTPADYLTSAWSGGTTTQLLIAPEGARYAGREFLWRVSSAAVELEESDFTPLKDYRRLIAALQGGIVLTHNDEAPISLGPLEVHAFDGADRTRCVGRCIDFNLMLRKGRADGRMDALRLTLPQTLLPDPRCEQQLLYCAEGACRISWQTSDGCLQTECARLCPGEALLVTGAVPVCAGPEQPGTVLMSCQMWQLSPQN